MVDINDILAWPIAPNRHYVVWSVSANNQRIEIAEIISGTVSAIETIGATEVAQANVVGKWINGKARIYSETVTG